MLNRRGLIHGVMAAAASLVGGKGPEEAPASKVQYKRIFRYCAEAKAWREIPWETMLPGDRVISLSDSKDCLQIEAFEVTGNPTTAPELDANGNPLGVVRVGRTFDLLPNIWGTPRQGMPPVRDARTLNVPPDFVAGSHRMMKPADDYAFKRSFLNSINPDGVQPARLDSVEPLTPADAPSGVPSAYEEVAF
jgi:hypothetical protein